MSGRDSIGSRRTARGTRRLGFETLEGRIVLSASSPFVADVAGDADEVAQAALLPNEITWVRSLTYQQFNLLNAEQAANLSVAQVASIPNVWWFSQMSDEARAALTAPQVQALRTATIRLSYLTPAQVGWLTVAQVRALTHHDDFRFLKSAQVPHLTPSQIALIPNDGAFSKWPEANRAALTSAQVQALRVADMGINRLPPLQVRYLSTAQIRALNQHQDFRLLSASQTPQLTPAQIRLIPDDHSLFAWPAASRAALTSTQVQALRVATVGISRLTPAQVGYLTMAQVQSLTNYDSFRYLLPAQARVLTPSQLARIPDESAFYAWPAANRQALTGAQITAINVGRVRINRLTPAQLGWLTQSQVQSINVVGDLALLPPSKIQFVTAAQIAMIPDEPTFAGWSEASRAALTGEQVKFLNVADVRINRLKPELIGWLTASQVQSLTHHADFKLLPPAKIQFLTASQIAKIPGEPEFAAWPASSRAALSRQQVQALRVTDVRIVRLTAAQVSYLTTAQIRSLTDYNDFQLLSPAQVTWLTNAQLATIPDEHGFNTWTAAARAALTAGQVQALRVNTIHLSLLTPAQVASLTTAQIQSVWMHDFKYLLPNQIPLLTPTQFATIDTEHILPNLSHEAQARMTREQLLALPLNILSRYMNDKPSQAPPAGYHLSTEAPLGPDGLPATPHVLEEAARVFALVPLSQATHVTVASGAWNDPAVWRNRVVPTAGAKVVISAGTTVTFNASMNFAIKTLRIDGTLSFAANINTHLKADTIVVFTTGVLRIGTVSAPIQNHVTARITIPDNGPIDRAWDPYSLSRGLISRGRVEMHGMAVTPYAELAVAPRAGATRLTLSTIPANWRVGDSLVLAGTDPAARDFQTERRVIRAISGNVVTIDALRYDHAPPAGYGLSVHVANETRNIQFVAEGALAPPAQRPHMMFLHNPAVSLTNIGVYGFGRTNKLVDVNDPVVVGGVLQPGTGTNPRARYAIHFHHTGVNRAVSPARVSGSIVVGSAGWGYVNHSSNVNMVNNVAVDVVGSSFVGEDGNEIGRMTGNLSINTTGSGEEIDDREANHDFGHSGHGFWLQGPGIVVRNNISAANRDAAYVFFTASSKTLFETANLGNPALGGGRTAVPVGAAPLAAFENNVAFASRAGVELWHHQQLMTDAPTRISEFTSWNTRSVGVDLHYSGQIRVENSTLLGDVARYSSAVGIRANVATNDLQYLNNVIAGFNIGVIAGAKRSNLIQGGSIAAVQRIVIYDKFDQTRAVDIRGVHFSALTEAQLNGRTPYVVYLSSYIIYIDRSPATLLSPDQIRYWMTPSMFVELLYFEQSGLHVPFPSSEVGDRVPPQYRDKTNLQLWTQYGIAYNGEILPFGATRPAGFYAMTRPVA